jgi:hypothetical protein
MDWISGPNLPNLIGIVIGTGRGKRAIYGIPTGDLCITRWNHPEES